MSQPAKLYRHTIVIWTDGDMHYWDIDAIAADAMAGNSYCESHTVETVTDSTKFPETDFFGAETVEIDLTESPARPGTEVSST